MTNISYIIIIMIGIDLVNTYKSEKRKEAFVSVRRPTEPNEYINKMNNRYIIIF